MRPLDPDQSAASQEADDGLVRIQVACRDGDPRAFYLGSRRLDVLRVIERAADGLTRRYRVTVPDGRVFLLSLNLASGDWRLASVDPYQRTA